MTDHQTVSSRRLSRIIRQVIDHAGTDERSDLSVVRLESDGTHLYAVATDRFTLAVARELLDRELNPDAQPFSVLLYPRDAAHLAKIADDEAFDDGQPWSAPTDFYTRLLVSDGRPPIAAAQVLVRKEGDIEHRDDVSAKYVPAPDVLPYDWRDLVRRCLQTQSSESAAVRKMAFNPQLLARWRSSDIEPLHFRFTGALNAVIVTGHNFLGVQLPVKPTDPSESFDAYASAWTIDLAPQAVDS
ncbi:MAG TPA: hypothetical protein VIN75_26030 [Burkholderiaceae bacterium]